MFRKSLAILTICILLVGQILIVPAFATPNIEAKSAVLIDGNTGRVLFSKNPHAKKPIASTTKIITGLLSIEKTSPEEVVTANKEVAATAESEIYLQINEKMTVHDLLYALLLQSANDAAVDLADYIAGSEKKFAKMMNKKAKELNLKNTSFRNPHGLRDVNISTAYDMAQLGRYALKNKVFASIVSTKKAKIQGKTKRIVYNRNKLLWRYPYAVGIKTGYTKAAGYCLVSAAKKGNMLLIATLLNAKTKKLSIDETISLFNHGFSEFKYKEIAKAGETMAKIAIPYHFKKMELVFKDDFGVVISNKAKVASQIHLKKNVELPIKKGDTLGYINIFEFENNKKHLIAKEKLKAKTNASKVSLFGKISYWIKSLFKS